MCAGRGLTLSSDWSLLVDRNGNVIPKLYSKAQANKGLREMLNIDGRKEQEVDDVSRLSDAELIQQLADMAKQLGVEIKLDYSFAQQALATEAASGPPVVDVTPDVTAQPPATEAASVTAADAAADAAAVDAARDLRIGLSPPVAGARPVRPKK